MIEFRAPPNDAPELASSPLLQAALLTLEYLEKNGPVGLTPAKALKRYFVTWAAETFEWPHYTAEDLLAINKVLNEDDVPPLVVLHDLLLSAKLARHRKGFLHITKFGKDLLRHPGSLWIALAEQMLLALDHSRYTRCEDRLECDWHLILNAVNVEAHAGVTEERFCAALLGTDESDYRLHSLAYVQILRPLCWLGLLHEARYGEPFPSERLFTKTPLWSVALNIETAPPLPPVTMH